MPPLALYIHIPWCIRKCPYCDFNSRALNGALDEMRYIDTLLADLDSERPQAHGRPLQSLFIGGGTPSLFSGPAITRLLQGIRQRLTLPDRAEITLEANPGASETGRFAAYRAAGVNRLSIGVQSFDAGALRQLGRIHGPDEAVTAFHAAREAGFRRINLDLMFGLPGQDMAQARRDLEQAIALEPEHISYYQLTLEPGTPFHRAPPATPPDDTLWTMQQQGEALLEAHGYRHYEVSAYARRGQRCRHNLNYWRFGDYLGIGAGAHGKITHPDGAITRRWRPAEPAAYQTAVESGRPLAGQQRLRADELPLEFMMNALRLCQGFPERLYSRHTGQPYPHIAATVESAIREGLLERRRDRLGPTPLGARFLNELLEKFL